MKIKVYSYFYVTVEFCSNCNLADNPCIFLNYLFMSILKTSNVFILEYNK